MAEAPDISSNETNKPYIWGGPRQLIHPTKQWEPMWLKQEEHIGMEGVIPRQIPLPKKQSLDMRVRYFEVPREDYQLLMVKTDISPPPPKMVLKQLEKSDKASIKTFSMSSLPELNLSSEARREVYRKTSSTSVLPGLDLGSLKQADVTNSVCIEDKIKELFGTDQMIIKEIRTRRMMSHNLYFVVVRGKALESCTKWTGYKDFNQLLTALNRGGDVNTVGIEPIEAIRRYRVNKADIPERGSRCLYVVSRTNRLLTVGDMKDVERLLNGISLCVSFEFKLIHHVNDPSIPYPRCIEIVFADGTDRLTITIVRLVLENVKINTDIITTYLN